MGKGVESAVHIMITGAASGIGKELCHRFARDENAFITMVDINKKGLDKMAALLQVPSSAYLLDLSDTDSVPAVINKIEQEQGPVDVLINCAGIMFIQNMATTGWEKGQRLFNIDLISPFRIINLLLPGMIKRGKGHIVNLSSMAGVITIAGCCYYGAAKAGLAFASEILRGEVARFGVGVTTVYLGPIPTPLEIQCRKEVHGNIWSDSIPVGRVDRVAELIYRAVKRNRARVVYPFTYKFVRYMRHLFSTLTMWLGPDPTE
ncbi:MAG: SDR family NAD(P)-dependent oxidoreductase [Firmicutes bacterium]|nr:SDR family NAD(P)-dependent oxidoreductase [Bacillota bacterium]